MDNGLIFPYPLTRAHAEPTDTNAASSSFGLRAGWWGSCGPEVVVGK
jgi:hypothetical protein